MTVGLALMFTGVAGPHIVSISLHGWKGVPRPVVIAIIPWMDLRPTDDRGRASTYVPVFAKVAQSPMPAWQQRLLARQLRACLRSASKDQRGLAAVYIQCAQAAGSEMRSCIPAIQSLADDPDHSVRETATNSFAMMTGDDAQFRLFWTRLLTESTDNEIRARAAVMLGRIASTGDRTAVPLLLNAFRDPSAVVQQGALAGLVMSRNPASLPALIEAAASNDYPTNAGACHGLERLEAAAAPAVPALLKIVRTPGHNSCVWAIIALGRIGPGAHEAVPDLLKLVQGPVPRTRIAEEALTALGRIGDRDEEVLRVVSGALDDSRRGVQRVSVEALYRLGWSPRGEDRGRIERIAAAPPGIDQLWARMILAREDGTLDAEVDRLIGLLYGQEWQITQHAAYALETLGPVAERALPALRKLCPPPGPRIEAEADLKQQAAEPAIRHITEALSR